MFSPRCPSSLSCINEHPSIDNGGNASVNYLRSNCSDAECFPEKSSCCWNEQDCPRVKCKALVFSPRCPSSLSCINEHPSIDSGGNASVNYLRSNCSDAECFPEKSSCCWNEQDCPRVKCKALRAVPHIVYCVIQEHTFTVHHHNLFS